MHLFTQGECYLSRKSLQNSLLPRDSLVNSPANKGLSLNAASLPLMRKASKFGIFQYITGLQYFCPR